MKYRRILLLIPLLVATLALPARAQTPVEGSPKLIDYQGTVLDLNGNPLAPSTPTNYTMKFRLYVAQSGGAAIWSEQQTVTVSNGQFSVRLGQGIAIGTDPRPDLSTMFNGRDRYLGLTVVIPPQAEGEITPRLAFLASPFSFVAERAKTADSVLQSTGTSTLGTTTITNFTLAGPGKINGGNFLEFGGGVVGKSGDAGKIGYGTFTPNTLDIVGAGSAGNGSDRKVKIFAEGGLAVSGPLTLTGNQTIAPPSSLSFGSTVRQMLNLYGTDYGLGVQSSTLYSRAGDNFAWFKGGAHHDTQNNPGAGGTLLANLNLNGLTLGVGQITAPAAALSGNLSAASGIFSSHVLIGGANSQLALNHFAYGNVTTTLKTRPSDEFLIYGENSAGGRNFSVTKDGYVEISSGFNASGVLNVGGRANFGGGTYGSQSVQMRAAAGDVLVLGLHNSADAELFSFFTNGAAAKIGGGSWSNYSDLRLKTKVEDFEGALDKMLKLHSVTFEYKDTKKYGAGRQTGFIAQEVEKIFPDWVGEGADKMKLLSIRGFESLTVQALRELRAEKDRQIAEKDRKIAELEKQVANLSTAHQTYEQRLARIEHVLVPAPSVKGETVPGVGLPNAPAPNTAVNISTPLKKPAMPEEAQAE